MITPEIRLDKRLGLSLKVCPLGSSRVGSNSVLRCRECRPEGTLRLDLMCWRSENEVFTRSLWTFLLRS
jgi:hypothetical protein